MTQVYEIRQLAAWIRGIQGAVQRATFRATARTLQGAERQAKINARNNFRGTRVRPKTGNLMNAIFSGYVEGEGPNLVNAVVGVKSHKGRAGTRPYGRIHEYGGTIRPVRAKYLWQPLFGPKSSGFAGGLRDMTPRSFIAAMKGGTQTISRAQRGKGFKAKAQATTEAKFAIFTSKAGNRIAAAIYGARRKILPLYLLRDSSVIPARPYVTPAVEAAAAALPGAIAAEVAKLEVKP